jgi:integrase
VRLTKTSVDKIQAPLDRDQAFYRDDQLKGFALRVTASGVKSFVVEKLIDRKVRRITLGRYGELTVEQARKEAQKLLGKIATGVNPLAEKQANKLQAITLDQAFQDYLKARKELKPQTLYGYKNVMNLAFSDWAKKPLLNITKDKVEKRHTLLGETRGQAFANLSMRLLRALFNFAAGQYEDTQGHSLIPDNPVKRLSQARAWYRIKRRQTYIKPHELKAWHQGVMQLENIILRDYLLLVIFTGLRRNEAAELKWQDIDLKAKTLTILDTKNHQSHILPLTDFLYVLLARRSEDSKSEYVFPGTGKHGFIIEPRKQMAKVIKTSGVSFTLHDLRRTFTTIAESLDISAYAIKRLINHKMNNDITSGYIVNDVERLRKPMQQITDYILKNIELD